MTKARRAKTPDQYVTAILQALEAYRKDHPRATFDAYRRNSASVRVRVIDSDFQGIDRVDRDDLVWKYLEPLPEDVQTEISMLVLVTPRERKTSLASVEFEYPSPSRL